MVALDHGTPRVFAKRLASVYRHGADDLEEAIHQSPDHTVRAVATADERVLLLLAGEDCVLPPFADLAISLHPTYVLGVGGPLPSEVRDVLDALDAHGITCYAVGFNKLMEPTS